MNSAEAPKEVVKCVVIRRNRGVKVIFSDDSDVVLTDLKVASEFLTKYIQGREEYISVMEYNRADDPRVTGELPRLQEEVRQLKEQVLQLQDLLREDR